MCVCVCVCVCVRACVVKWCTYVTSRNNTVSLLVAVEHSKHTHMHIRVHTQFIIQYKYINSWYRKWL